MMGVRSRRRYCCFMACEKKNPGPPMIRGPEGGQFMIVVAEFWDEHGNVIETQVRADDKTMEAGQHILNAIGAALRLADRDGRIRALARCVSTWRAETLRSAAVHEFMDGLVLQNDVDAIDRVLGEYGGRGRRARTTDDDFAEVELIDEIRRRDGCGTAEAVRTGLAEVAWLRGKCTTAEAICNSYSKNKRRYDLFRRVRLLPGAELAEHEWTRPSTMPSRKSEKK